MNSSERHDWNTPDDYLGLVRSVFGGPVGLDPCSNATSRVGARVTYDESDDGLAQDWQGRGPVFVNPPYGRALPAWVAKVVEEGGKGAEIILLVPSRTETHWFRAARKACDALAFANRRIRFRTPELDGQPAHKSKNNAPSVTFYFGTRIERFQEVFGEGDDQEVRGQGWVVVPWLAEITQ
jgi:site-specific DNA-methyltransferase (adenine-specific)